MNILILNWRDIKHPLAGGAEISVYEHALFWQKQGATITWYAASFPGAKKEEFIDGIHIIRSGSQFTVHLLLLWKSYLNVFREYDIIVDCFHFLPFLTFLYPGKQKKIAMIHEVAGKLWFHNIAYPLALIGYIIEKIVINIYAFYGIPFITVSNSTKTDLVKEGIKKENIFIIHNGCNILIPKATIKKEKDPSLIFIGRISLDKGIDDLFKAYKLIKKEFPLVKLMIVGKEEKKGDLDTFTRRYFTKPLLKEDVHYYGYVSEEKKFELLKKAWILIHPSKKEGWGLTVIEAASQATPTVGYRVGGLQDSILHGITGVLTNDDASSLAFGVCNLLANATIYAKMTKEAKKHSQVFTWKESGMKSWDILKNL